jgi:hypothetical protein
MGLSGIPGSRAVGSLALAASSLLTIFIVFILGSGCPLRATLLIPRCSKVSPLDKMFASTGSKVFLPFPREGLRLAMAVPYLEKASN